MDAWVGVLSTVAPSIGVGLIFFFVIRSVIRADRREREYLRELDNEDVQATSAVDDPGIKREER
ncbi:hypothetical protein GCM10010401_05600 [Rarobacter faecitabidus]|uniref:Uncharacterized protein n=1 Tax=Rarobacter faecitabidus TaxID=13243 RepID=A0A542ZTT3_RARFA|nr:hypothetical protein [Rarobacter faecitabidus]TQL63689.1 hypothetical protein FB461_0157 [Rarobacter faecitabidus]